MTETNILPINYYHFSNKQIDKLLPRVYEQQPFILKPSGLWFSKNNEWLEWCESEGYKYTNQSFRYKLEIDFRGILVIDSIDNLNWFKKTYSKGNKIMWTDVATDYDGIYFDNYYEIKGFIRENKRFEEFLWYFGIDVNSGCIFNTRCIKNFTLF